MQKYAFGKLIDHKLVHILAQINLFLVTLELQ